MGSTAWVYFSALAMLAEQHSPWLRVEVIPSKGYAEALYFLLDNETTLSPTFKFLYNRAVQGVKEAMLRGIEMSLADGLALESELGRRVNSSKDFAEGMKAFAEKRKPNYTGE